MKRIRIDDEFREAGRFELARALLVRHAHRNRRAVTDCVDFVVDNDESSVGSETVANFRKVLRAQTETKKNNKY